MVCIVNPGYNAYAQLTTHTHRTPAKFVNLVEFIELMISFHRNL